MHQIPPSLLQQDIIEKVALSLKEDVGDGDMTALLVPADQFARARVITREAAVIAGQPWVNEVVRQTSEQLSIVWQVSEGQQVAADSLLFSLEGPARAILTAERSALNWLQCLSGTATLCRHYADLVAHTPVKLLDTRKTLPGLRLAQKYAVTQGGCFNHRIGLYDAFLIKENHIAACGSIAKAVAMARQVAPGKPVEVEVEHLGEFDQALAAGADVIMLDEFSLQDMRSAVAKRGSRAKLEASGGIDEARLVTVAETGIDFISLGLLTKNVRAIDLSMRLFL